MRFEVTAGGGGPLTGRVVVADAVTGRPMTRAAVRGTRWTLDVPRDWPSSLYVARFHDDRPETPEPERDPEHEVWFAVRAARPATASAVLVSIPFATWRAYHRAGQPGRSIYYAEEPGRAARVSFTDPGGGPPPERWEEPLLRWLPEAGYPVEFCSGLDLDDGRELLSAYRLLIVNGHDEYWSAGMRDSVEEFVRRGGNLAVFAGNTAWWQMRLEDGGRTMVCHRDATTDPVAATDPRRTTVEWSSSPVDRPENSMTGVSFRNGAGSWGAGMSLIGRESYTVRFADHWVFEGTGLGDGDAFARGALGYETDAAELDWSSGVPRATGRDGTPRSFAVLATADLRHWRTYGQGGWATMGVFRLGAGTVFNAATINWGRALDDPAVDRVTRNVLDRLGGAVPVPSWHTVGRATGVRALAACEGLLFAVAEDGRTLLHREPCDQNLPWTACPPVPGGPEPEIRCLAAPREACHPTPLALLAVGTDDRLLVRDPVPGPAPWTPAGTVPAGTTALAMCDNTLFAVTPHDDTLHHRPALRPEAPWTALGPAGKAVSLAVLNARLYACGPDGLLTRPPVTTEAPFAPAGAFPAATALAAYAGRLLAATDDGLLVSHRPRSVATG
ncbi:N,N-dimethylformamidase beta subunit family domain-containing protein [Streptomyces sp. NBC_00525]|uniref:N,N-dimethylformamidase beta subunit family domain-containing protein n=1 Tax=Streptomyces sp. NBC_00525 TaxID=2903660 RepID=UPI002E804203|nr:N,N-dimethylformamidase beta subunit family domain-containing protein [Streptomyces sp. NBC_00525]WUC92438.1 GldG family protein [Streptomyces sp. NBC_00525]